MAPIEIKNKGDACLPFLDLTFYISDDLDEARKAGKRGLSGYPRFPCYQRMIKNIDFGDFIEKFKEGANPPDLFTDEFVDSVALIGPTARCRERLEAYREAGVQLPSIVPNPVGKQTNVELMKNMIQALAI
ncbi:MAG: hypothetical protein ACREOW_17200 [Thermodesulfobacteriota bacterium]